MASIRPLIGKVLGEIYRLQDASGSGSGRDRSHIFGLLKGIEQALDEEIELTGSITNEQLDSMVGILTKAQENPEFRGYYDIESHLKQVNISREAAKTILTYLYNGGRFTDVIEKMDSCHSPIECKRFELDEWNL